MLARRVLTPLAEAHDLAAAREDSLRNRLYGEDSLYDQWDRADSLAFLAEAELELDANERGDYMRRGYPSRWRFAARRQGAGLVPRSRRSAMRGGW